MSLRLFPMAALLALLVGCTTRDGTISGLVPPLVSETPVAAPQQDDQTLWITVFNGKFLSTLYEEQPGATQLLVVTEDGPYLFEIDSLVGPRELPANTETMILFDVSAEGQYTMRAYQSTPTRMSPDFASAVLDVRSAVDR